MTVLAATLHGLEGLDDIEETDDLVTQAIGQLTPEVYRFEGCVPQVAGHGFIALFGAPIACEDHVLRALHAAFGLQRALKHIEPRWKPKPHHDLSLGLHIALHTGPVTIGPIGSDLNVQALTQGTTCQIAMHIQQQTAAVNQRIVASDAVRQQAAGFFEFVDDDRLTLPMVRQPVPISTCTEPLSAGSRLEVSLARQHTAFCGRSDEMTRLRTLWMRVCNAEGQVVCLIGEAGNDILEGGPGNDDLIGTLLDEDEFDNDVLKGDSGHDFLFSGDGHDYLEGGSGHDSLCGGRGQTFCGVVKVTTSCGDRMAMTT